MSAIPGRADAQEHRQFEADVQVTARLVVPPEGRCIDQAGQPLTIALLEATGAGNANISPLWCL